MTYTEVVFFLSQFGEISSIHFTNILLLLMQSDSLVAVPIPYSIVRLLRTQMLSLYIVWDKKEPAWLLQNLIQTRFCTTKLLNQTRSMCKQCLLKHNEGQKYITKTGY